MGGKTFSDRLYGTYRDKFGTKKFSGKICIRGRVAFRDWAGVSREIVQFVVRRREARRVFLEDKPRLRTQTCPVEFLLRLELSSVPKLPIPSVSSMDLQFRCQEEFSKTGFL
jgi:hypothetical protein